MAEIIEKLKGWLNLGVLPLLGILLFTSFFIFLPFVFSTTFLLATNVNGFSVRVAAYP